MSALQEDPFIYYVGKSGVTSSHWGTQDLHQTLIAEEGDGIDRECPQAVQYETFEEDPHSFFSDAHSHAVEDPPVLPPTGPWHLQPGFHHIHGSGKSPGHHSGYSTCHQYCKCTWGQKGLALSSSIMSIFTKTQTFFCTAVIKSHVLCIGIVTTTSLMFFRTEVGIHRLLKLLCCCTVMPCN